MASSNTSSLVWLALIGVVAYFVFNSNESEGGDTTGQPTGGTAGTGHTAPGTTTVSNPYGGKPPRGDGYIPGLGWHGVGDELGPL